MMRALLLMCLVAGCRGPEGGLQFSYALYSSNGTTPAPNCFEAEVGQIRVIIGNDDNRNGDLDEDEYIGRALSDCNQVDRDQNGQLALSELAVFETESDRLPAGEYADLLVELPAIEDSTLSISVRFHAGTTFASGVHFFSTNGPLFEIREGEVTQFDFSAFTGGFAEARFAVQTF
jgi:hypothetical protein